MNPISFYWVVKKDFSGDAAKTGHISTMRWIIEKGPAMELLSQT